MEKSHQLSRHIVNIQYRFVKEPGRPVSDNISIFWIMRMLMHYLVTFGDWKIGADIHPSRVLT